MNKKNYICIFIAIVLMSCLSVTYASNELDNSSAATLQNKRKAFLKKFSSYNITRISEADPDDPDFWFEFKENSRNFDTMRNLNNNENNIQNMSKKEKVIPSSSRTTANTAYNVYSSSGVKKNSAKINNLFEAINIATNFGDYVQETDTAVKVFIRDNSTSTYYRFQYTNYYNSASHLAYSPDGWVNAFNYAHVIDGTGHIIKNSYNVIAGLTPPAHALEPESGSYYYKFSNGWSADSCSNTIDFSNVTYKINLSSNNLYIFSAAQTSQDTAEIGIMCSRESLGKWWHYYRDSTTNDNIRVYKNRYAAIPTRSNNTTYTYSFGSGISVLIQLSLTDTAGKLTGVIGEESYDLKGSSFSKSNNCTLIQAVSMPEAVSEGKIPNLRCGSYLKNVKFTNCKLYEKTDYKGENYNFYPDNSTVMNTAFIYCDDTITYNRTNSNTETISIDYSIGYSN